MKINVFFRQKKVLFTVLMSIFLLFVYWPVTKIFFEQDAWHNMGYHLAGVYQYGWWNKLLHTDLMFIPITQTLNFLFYTWWGAAAWPFAWTVYFLILINFWLWTYFVYTVTKNYFVAIFASLFSFFNPIALQAYSWVAPAMAGHLSLFFMILALIFTQRLSFKKITPLQVFLIVFFAVCAFWTKINGVLIFLLIPLYIVIYKIKFLQNIWNSFFEKKKKIFFLTAFLLSLFLLGVGAYYFLGLSGRSVYDFKRIVTSIFILPTKSLSQMLLAIPERIYALGHWYLSHVFHMPFPNPKYFYSVITELISLLLSLLLLFFISSIFVFKRLDKNEKKIFLWNSSFYFLHFALYSVDIHSVGLGFLESRYYFLALFPLGVIVGKTVEILFRNIIKSKLLFFLGALIFSLYLGQNMQYIRQHLIVKSEYTQKRYDILQHLNQEINQLESENFIIYIEDIGKPMNTTGQYFQTGVFYPLLIMRAFQDNSFFFPVHADTVLWSIEYQGVLQENDKFWGYFYDRAVLDEYLQENPAAEKNVIHVKVNYSPLENRSDTTGWIDDLRFTSIEFQGEK